MKLWGIETQKRTSLLIICEQSIIHKILIKSLETKAFLVDRKVNMDSIDSRDYNKTLTNKLKEAISIQASDEEICQIQYYFWTQQH